MSRRCVPALTVIKPCLCGHCDYYQSRFNTIHVHIRCITYASANTCSVMSLFLGQTRSQPRRARKHSTLSPTTLQYSSSSLLI